MRVGRHPGLHQELIGHGQHRVGLVRMRPGERAEVLINEVKRLGWIDGVVVRTAAKQVAVHPPALHKGLNFPPPEKLQLAGRQRCRDPALLPKAGPQLVEAGLDLRQLQRIAPDRGFFIRGLQAEPDLAPALDVSQVRGHPLWTYQTPARA